MTRCTFLRLMQVQEVQTQTDGSQKVLSKEAADKK